MICIYAIINIVDDKLYVGQAADRDYRWKEHRKQLRGFYHHNLYLQRAWSKHGEQNFIFVVLETFDDTAKLNEREAHWARVLNADYNIASPGQGMRGYKHTEEARAKMRETHIGKSHHTDEWKAELSEKMKGNTWNKGRKQSPEEIEARAKHHRGKIVSAKTRARMSASLRGRTMSDITKRKMSEAAKRRWSKLDKSSNVNSIADTSSWSDYLKTLR